MRLGQAMIILVVAIWVSAMCCVLGQLVASPQLLAIAGPFVCPAGTEIQVETPRYSYHAPGETSVEVSCVGGGVAEDVTIRAGLVLWAMFFLPALPVAALVVIGGARWLRRRRLTLFERAGRMMASTLTVDGQSYTSMDELPPEAQEALEQVREAFRDADQDGTPDIMEGMDAQVLDLRSMRAGAGSAERMRELKRMLDEGLISLDEYEEKKGQILSEL